MNYTISETLEKHKKVIEDFKNKYPKQNYVISEQIISDQKALIYEQTIDNNPAYIKTVWLVKDDIKYIISWNVIAQSVQARDKLKNQYNAIFDKMVSTFKFSQ